MTKAAALDARAFRDRRKDPCARLVRLVRALRTHCPWDRKQTLASLRRHTIEEFHEWLEALDDAEQGAWDALREEIGDMALHLVFYAQIAEEQGAFSWAEALEGVIDKMIARHPQLFGGAPQPWHQTKQAAKGRASLLDGVPKAMPALVRAERIQARAAEVGFDWPDPEAMLAKVHEEAEELVRARAESPSRAEEELGDLLFVLVNLARRLGLDPERALHRATDKFERRFRAMEAEAEARGAKLSELDLEAMEALYQNAKRKERS